MTTKTTTRLGLDVKFLDGLLTDPDLFASELPGESELEAAARRAAAEDITDAYVEASIADHPDGIAAGVAHVAELARARTDRWTAEARTKVARWLNETGEVAA